MSTPLPHTLSLNRHQLLAGAGASLLPASLFAQAAWPIRPVRIGVPFAPAGTADIRARALGPELGKAFGQVFIIDKRPGAGDNLGADMVAKSAPDGYKLLMAPWARTPSMRCCTRRCRSTRCATSSRSCSWPACRTCSS